MLAAEAVECRTGQPAVGEPLGLQRDADLAFIAPALGVAGEAFGLGQRNQRRIRPAALRADAYVAIAEAGFCAAVQQHHQADAFAQFRLGGHVVQVAQLGAFHLHAATRMEDCETASQHRGLGGDVRFQHAVLARAFTHARNKLSAVHPRLWAAITVCAVCGVHACSLSECCGLGRKQDPCSRKTPPEVERQ
ncbi:MAG: hypothetical protein REI94_16560 [Moraxellaceae bacterium]|nr:hypothetical protein [Moraxellaceae bacterium]